MDHKIATAVVTALVLATTASAVVSAPRGGPAAGSYQGDAPAWSFACIKDHGPTQCGEPVWIYGK